MISNIETKSGECYYNPHFLYVESGAATQSQIETAFKKGIKDVSVRLNKKFSNNLRVNVVSDRNHNKFGYSYIWVEDDAVYNMLLGKNIDGSHRVEYKNEPGWICPPREEEVEDYSLDTFSWNDKRSWADIIEEEEEKEKKYQCPQLKIILPPLMILPSFPYTEVQKIELQKINEKINEIPSECILVPGRAYANDIEEKKCHNILFAKYVPENITEQMIKEKFEMFASDRYHSHNRKNNGKITSETYPYVTINRRRYAFVTFDYRTRDASFARLINRKLEFEIDSKSYILIFEHSYKTKLP